MGYLGVDNKMLLQCVILSLMEDDGMTIHQVLDLTKNTTADVWHGLRQERLEEAK